MNSTADTYRAAATEHLSRALDQFNAGEYFLAHYLAGLAVECHLRAWLRRKTSDFDPRHDLDVLAKASDFYTIIPEATLADISATVALINLRWRSNQRYYSERQLLDYVNSLRAEYNKPGDRKKNLARTLVAGAYDVVSQGESKWKTK